MKHLLKGFAVACLCLAALTAVGCAKERSALKDTQADLLGLSRTISVYDFNGARTEYYEGDNVRIDKSDVANAILITMDGRSITMVGNTAIIAEKGVENRMEDPDFAAQMAALQQELSQPQGGGSGLPFLDKRWNQMLSGITGLNRILIVKSESGAIIGVFQGKNVLLEASDLEKTTKVLIDGKRLHLHRTNYSIIELN